MFDSNFSEIFANFRRKNAVFIKNQRRDQISAQTGSSFSKNATIF
jgi:hypothetical protein